MSAAAARKRRNGGNHNGDNGLVIAKDDKGMVIKGLTVERFLEKYKDILCKGDRILEEHLHRTATDVLELTGSWELTVFMLLHHCSGEDLARVELSSMVPPHYWTDYELIRSADTAETDNYEFKMQAYRSILARRPLLMLARAIDIGSLADKDPKERLGVYERISQHRPDPRIGFPRISIAVREIYFHLIERMKKLCGNCERNEFLQGLAFRLQDLRLATNYSRSFEACRRFMVDNEETLKGLKERIDERVMAEIKGKKPIVLIKSRVKRPGSTAHKLVDKAGEELNENPTDTQIYQMYLSGGIANHELKKAVRDFVGFEVVLENANNIEYYLEGIKTRLEREGFVDVVSDSRIPQNIVDEKERENEENRIYYINAVDPETDFRVEVQVTTENISRLREDTEVLSHAKYKGFVLDPKELEKMDMVAVEISRNEINEGVIERVLIPSLIQSSVTSCDAERQEILFPPLINIPLPAEVTVADIAGATLGVEGIERIIERTKGSAEVPYVIPALLSTVIQFGDSELIIMPDKKRYPLISQSLKQGSKLSLRAKKALRRRLELMPMPKTLEGKIALRIALGITSDNW